MGTSRAETAVACAHARGVALLAVSSLVLAACSGSSTTPCGGAPQARAVSMASMPARRSIRSAGFRERRLRCRRHRCQERCRRSARRRSVGPSIPRPRIDRSRGCPRRSAPSGGSSRRRAVRSSERSRRSRALPRRSGPGRNCTHRPRTGRCRARRTSCGSRSAPTIRRSKRIAAHPCAVDAGCSRCAHSRASHRTPSSVRSRRPAARRCNRSAPACRSANACTPRPRTSRSLRCAGTGSARSSRAQRGIVLRKGSCDRSPRRRRRHSRSKSNHRRSNARSVARRTDHLDRSRGSHRRPRTLRAALRHASVRAHRSAPRRRGSDRWSRASAAGSSRADQTMHRRRARASRCNPRSPRGERAHVPRRAVQTSCGAHKHATCHLHWQRGLCGCASVRPRNGDRLRRLAAARLHERAQSRSARSNAVDPLVGRVAAGPGPFRRLLAKAGARSANPRDKLPS